jgi:hypothetical protein
MIGGDDQNPFQCGTHGLDRFEKKLIVPVPAARSVSIQRKEQALIGFSGILNRGFINRS